MSNTLYNRTSWTTQHALSSEHLPIITTINIRHDYRLQQNRRTFTNYKKADWTQFTEDTESAFAQTTIPTNIHTTNRIFFTNIRMENKYNIPKGKMHRNGRLLPDHIVCKITQRNNIRRANTCDLALKLLNEEITSDIQKHKQNIWKRHRQGHLIQVHIPPLSSCRHWRRAFFHTYHTPTHHGYKTQHSTATALHTLNNTVEKGFKQMAPPLARTITVALDMSKAFDIINIHTLIRKFIQTKIPDTIFKFIANYIKGRKAYTI